MGPARRRPRRWFWLLIAVAVIAMGTLYRALSAPPGPGTALTVLGSGVVLTLTLIQADRVRAALSPPPRPLTQVLRRPARTPTAGGPDSHRRAS